MSVSRETFGSAYSRFLKKNPSASLALSDLDLLSLVLPFHKNSYLLVEGSDFESANDSSATPSSCSSSSS